MKNKRKWISKAAMTLGVLTMLGAAGTGAINVAFAEDQAISVNPVSDNTSARKITVWKYEINSASELGERGDGINPDPSQAPDLGGKKLMEGVKFEIIKVKAIGNANLTDPLQQVEDTDWEVDTSFAKMEDETDANGKLTFDVSALLGANEKKKADGIYLVREVPNDEGEYTYLDENGDRKKITKPMDPFFVHLPQTKRDDTGKLIYDVHVYPKNIVTDTELDKTVEGGKGFSIKAGNSFQWEATTKLPDGLYAIAPDEMPITNYVDPDTGLTSDRIFAKDEEIYASYFRVSDNISADLMLEDVEVYALAADGTPTLLTNGTEYKVTLGSGGGTASTIAPGSKVEDLTLGATKDVVVSLTKAGMKKLGVDEDTHLQVVYKVKADKDYNGTISNQYKIDYLLPGGTPDSSESDEPEYYNGGLDIKKTDKAGADLSGAEFHIATSSENAEKGIFLASNGKSYKKDTDKFGTAETPEDGATFLTSVSDTDGNAHFDGLKLEWFTDNPSGPNANDGKQDPNDPTEATWDEADIKKDYWVVETKSPSGYELLKTPEKVTVTLATHEDSTIEVTVVNEPETKLPFTGGTGTMLLVIIAIGAITIGTAAIAIDKKRRAV